MTDSVKLAARLAPIIRRGRIVGEAQAVVLFAILPKEAEAQIWYQELTKESDFDVLANEAACAAIEETEGGGAVRFRLDALHDGAMVATLVFRTRAEKRSDDPIGDAIGARTGEDHRDALIRQLMRHTETASRLAVSANERREEHLLQEIRRQAEVNQRLQTELEENIKRNREYLKEEHLQSLALLEQDERNRMMREGVELLKRFGPRLVARITGADKLSPVAEVLRSLSAEQLTLLEQSGVVSPEQVKDVREAWRLLQDDRPSKRPALPANGKGGAS